MRNKRHSSARNRYNTRGVWWSDTERRETPTRVFDDSSYFSSIFELDIYRRLREFSSIVVFRQYRLTVKDATEQYPRIDWRCDFRVEHKTNHEKFLNIEVKGYFQPEFKNTLKYLEFFSPYEYSHLVLVAKDHQKVDNYFRTWTVDDIPCILETRGLK